MEWLERTALLIKPEGIERLQKSNVLVVGTGGIGSFAVEFLVRAGLGNITIVDADVIDITNTNRQIPALHSTVGQKKVAVMKNRMLDINPALNITTLDVFLTPENVAEIVAQNFDYAIDCIDSITPKITLIEYCVAHNIPIISCLGAGGKMDPAAVRIKRLKNTENCKLGKVLRKRIKAKSVLRKCMTVYSEEHPNQDSLKLTDGSNFKKSFYGTISYMPALFGLHAAGHVVQKLLS